MGYVAPLRQAVIDLGRRGRPWTVAAMANLGGAADGATKAYATTLRRAGVLIELTGGRLTTGRFFVLWSNLNPNTEPGGNRKLKATG